MNGFPRSEICKITTLAGLSTCLIADTLDHEGKISTEASAF